MTQPPTTDEEAPRATIRPVGVERHRWWRLLIRRSRPALRILIIAAVIEFLLLPQIAGARKSWSLLTGVSPMWLVVCALCSIASLLAYGRLSQVTLATKGVGFGQLMRIDLATLAVSRVVPAGSAVGAGLGYRLLVRSGVQPAVAVSGRALQTIGSAVVLNLLLAGSLIAALALHGNNPLYLPIVSAGLVLVVVAGVLAILISRNEERFGNALARVLGKLPRVSEDAGRRFISSLADVLRRLGHDRRFLVRAFGWAAANWLLDAAALWAGVRAFGHSLGPVGLLVAYGLANVAAALPVTPGGLGIVEGILVPTLVAFSTQRGMAILGVLAYRLISFWIPIPIGFAAYAGLEMRLRRRHEPKHPDRLDAKS